MKKIVVIFLMMSLLFTGCSDSSKTVNTSSESPIIKEKTNTAEENNKYPSIEGDYIRAIDYSCGQYIQNVEYLNKVKDIINKGKQIESINKAPTGGYLFMVTLHLTNDVDNPDQSSDTTTEYWFNGYYFKKVIGENQYEYYTYSNDKDFETLKDIFVAK